MNQNQFEYFPMGDQGHTLDADTFEGAIREARILNKAAGIPWAGLIGMAGDGEFLGSIQVVGFD